MKLSRGIVAGAGALLFAFTASTAFAKDLTIGVSWSNFQEERNADFLHEGRLEVLDAAIKSGDIKVVGEQYTDGWLPENAQKNMEQILTANDNKVDAVVASNDGTAGGVVAALTAQGLEGCRSAARTVTMPP